MRSDYRGVGTSRLASDWRAARARGNPADSTKAVTEATTAALALGRGQRRGSGGG